MGLISRIEPTLGSLEEEYRLHFLKEDNRFIGTAMIFSSVFVLALVRNDYIFFGNSLQFWLVVISRVVFVISVAALIVLLRRLQKPSTCDWVVLISLLVCCACIAYVHYSRPTAHHLIYIFNVMAVFGLYMLYSSHLPFRAAPAFALSISTVTLAFPDRHTQGPHWYFAVVLCMFSANFMGIVISCRWNNLRRNLFRAMTDIQNGEKRLAESLETAERLREEAQAASRAKSEFLANMSHELRTPLNAILGFAQLMLRDHHATSTQRENLNVIARSGDHLLDLINDVLTLSRIEAGRIELDAAPFDLYETLEGVDSIMRLHADNKNLSLQIKRASDVPRYVKTDQAKLRQVIVNLLGNAIKFTERGDVALRVGCLPPPENESSATVLSFDVEDTGPGIPASDLESIFDPFVQATIGRSSQEGTGLGLPISRRFVRLMGGDISVTSEEGKGSTFYFHIEIEPATAEDLSAVDRFREIIGLAPGQPEYRILIVEDNPQNRGLLVKLLQPLGFHIREAVNGQEGIEISEEWDPNLIFMDMRMPVMDGFEATRRIRSSSRGKDIRIVGVTASVFVHEKQLVMNAGCDDFIRKPIRSEKIFETLARHLEVRFMYSNEADEVTDQTQMLDDEDVRERLRALHPEWVSRLNEAAVAGDIEETAILVEEIRMRDRALSDILRRLLKQFNFDKIVAFTEQMESQR